ncbi:hypothetical protein [Neobacillus vireti]|uniref:hypothetical protein n=1 Tax=Neobacillus vireti TaxID=220686 RepID=UPI002FFDDE40
MSDNFHHMQQYYSLFRLLSRFREFSRGATASAVVFLLMAFTLGIALGVIGLKLKSS